MTIIRRLGVHLVAHPMTTMHPLVARVLAALLLIPLSLLPSGPAPAAEAARVPVRVMLPEMGNLQFLSFWVARGAGYFAEEGLDMRLFVAPSPGAVAEAFIAEGTDVALLPPPGYGQLIERQQPVVVFANLLTNHPVNLIVHRDVVAARPGVASLPLAERLRRLQGIRIGVAPGPLRNLQMLFASVGLNVNRDVEVVTLPGEEQNDAFGARRVDALYTHTPYLEQALVRQGAQLLVNQSGGEVAEFTRLQIHSVVATRTFAAAQPGTLVAMARAIHRAQLLLHADQKRAADALLGAGLPHLERPLIETLLAVSARSVPMTPEVLPDGLRRAVTLFGGGRATDLSAVNLGDYLAPEIAREAMVPRVRTRWTAMGGWSVLPLVLLAASGVALSVILGAAARRLP